MWIRTSDTDLNPKNVRVRECLTFFFLIKGPAFIFSKNKSKYSRSVQQAFVTNILKRKRSMSGPFLPYIYKLNICCSFFSFL